VTSKQQLPRVAILALPEATASVTYGMFDLFCSAGRDWGMITSGVFGDPLVDAEIVSRHEGSLEVANGAVVRPHRGLTARRYDVVCVPELAIPPNTALDGKFDEEIGWIRKQFASGAIVATACSGAVLLAAAGLLDGLEATTHWAYCDTLEQRYPTIRVHRDRALVASGVGHRLVMAGGGTTWLDLALYLLSRVVSVEAAMQVARMNLIDWHDMGQEPYARLVRARQVDDAVIARCQEWIGKRPTVEAPVASMVRVSGLPERTFKRRFQKAAGMTPLEYVHGLRLERAKTLLETTELKLEQIAEKAGYEDTGFFSRLFRRTVGLTPVQYRRRFGAVGRAVRGER
jgi:transcriptional regulator GlxA family with amidase domain